MLLVSCRYWEGIQNATKNNALLERKEQTFLFVRLVERRVLVFACPAQLLLPSSGPTDHRN